MRCVHGVASVVAILTISGTAFGQAGGAMANQETNRTVAGGIKVPGWTGKADANGQNQTVDSSSVNPMAGGFHVQTGPAMTIWNATNKATGDYTIKATFNEPKYQNLNTHPHPYGIMIAGNDLGTADASYLYCSAYGNGTYIVRGFGPATFAVSILQTAPQRAGRGGALAAYTPDTSSAVHKAAGIGAPVMQEIALQVKGGKVSCIINGTTVASFDKAALVAAGKLKSTDGIYGLRFAHNSEVMVTGFSMTKP